MLRNISVRTFLYFFLPMSLSACSGEVRDNFLNEAERPFTARYWQTPALGDDYPEMQDTNIRRRASFGVAFQGGGNRAAPAALGQLRALHELGWIDEVRYISAISGGSWASIPYTFLKNGSTPAESDALEARFLGENQDFRDLADTILQLDSDPNGTAADTHFGKGSMLGAISDSAVAGRMIDAWLRGRFDEAYASALEDIYLTPFDLGRSDPSQPDTLFTWRAEDERRLRESGRDFSGVRVHTVERDRPYLIVGGSLLTERENIDADEKFRTEMTPLYTGLPRALEFRTDPNDPDSALERRVGGGFVESYGYDYVTNRVNRNTTPVELELIDPQFGNRTDVSRLNFSLANMAAVSGAAPVETIITKFPSSFVLSNVGFPEHFVPLDQKNIPYVEAFANPDELFQKEWAHGDGGHEDNLGLAPLLARQVENIIVFANAFEPLKLDEISNCKNLLNSIQVLPEAKEQFPPCISEMAGEHIASYFLHTPTLIHNDSLSLHENGSPPTEQFDIRRLQDLVDVAEDLAPDGISCRDYDYRPSKEMVGLTYSPTICFVYLSFDATWLREVLEAGGDKERQLAVLDALGIAAEQSPEGGWKVSRPRRSGDFPHIKTFLDRPPFLIKTARPRLFALSHFTSWTLQNHHDIISESFRRNGLRLR